MESSLSPKLKATLLTLHAIFITAVLVLAFVFLPKDNKSSPATKLQSIKLPDNVLEPDYPHYTASGKIVFLYRNSIDNQHYVAVINDDGTDLRNIYNGEPKPFYNNTNGIRLMPFKDNKRILLGDGILECEPSIDEVTDPEKQTKIIPIEYPEELLKFKSLFMLWSEIIISPDNVHMGWSSLLYTGAIVFISRLERLESHSNERNFISPRIDITRNKNVANDVKYVMKNVQIVSDLAYMKVDPDHPGFIIPSKYIHGGEIKQFTFDCQKLTLVGATTSGLARSVLQNLNDDIVSPICHEAGYDETTIISPNGKLGIVMTSRFSPKTSCSILGILPRPYSSFGLMSFTQAVYTYSVTGVRLTRKGNIGPALIDIEESLNDNDQERKYHGIDIHDPKDEYVFRSPMSWHYSSQRAIWLENAKNQMSKTRIRQVILDSSVYPASEPLKCEKETPDNIPYALDISALANMSVSMYSGKIASPLGIEKGGYINFEYKTTSTNVTYVNYTEDGTNFFDGSEGYSMNYQTMGSYYQGNVVMFNLNGNQRKVIGEMNCKITFSNPNNDMKLIREESYGKATYKGVTVTVDDMED